MQLIFYLILFVLALLFFLLSTDIQKDFNSKTYQVQYSIFSVVLWSAVAINSFNVQINSVQNYDYTLIGIAIIFMIMSLLNAIVIMFYGSFGSLFRVPEEQ
jgi:hypothetical protein